MSNSTWLYANNPFIGHTTNSYRLMNLLASDHEAKLRSNTGIPLMAAMSNRFTPVYLAYASLYSDWLAARNEYMKATQVFTEALSKLSSELIEKWDAKILIVYSSRSADYKKLLPGNRGAFQRGPYDDRIRLVHALIKNLQTENALAALRSEVEAFYYILKTARDEQQGLERRVSALSSAVDDQRIVTGRMMYANLGLLMDHFNEKPEEVSKFFDLEYIRNTGQSNEEEIAPAVTLGINPGATVESGLTFTADTQLRISNTGPTSLRLCMSTAPGNPCAEGRLLQPGESLEGSAADHGWTEGMALNISNAHTGMSGAVEVYLM